LAFRLREQDGLERQTLDLLDRELSPPASQCGTLPVNPVVAQNAQWMTWKPACGADPTDAERNLSNFTGGEIRRVAVMISSESVG
jgi:hypothetical protein